MPAVAKIGTDVRVTPSDDIQIIYSKGHSEFVEDRSSFSFRVSGLIEEAGEVIGVYGGVISGHDRYRGKIVTLLVRLDHSDWRSDNRSAANFKVGEYVARPNGHYPIWHPDGTDVGFPVILRYGSIDSRSLEEPEVNSAQQALGNERGALS